MIQYSKITLRRLIDELLIRMGKHRSAMNLDWDTLIRIANHSIRETASIIMPYEGASFIRRIEDVVNEDAMPRTFVRRSRFIYEDDSIFKEARYVDIKEYFNVTNDINVHSFNHSYDYAPIYTFWGQADDPTDPIEFRVYLHPIATTGHLDYYAMPVELTAETDVVPIPEEYMDIVIYSAMQRIFARTTMHSQIMEIQKRLATEKDKLYAMYAENKKMEERELDSFVQPVVPLVPSQPEEGELPKKL